MSWWLNGEEESGSCAADFLLYSLNLSGNDSRGLRERSLERYRRLSESQAAATARFLTYVSASAEKHDRETAQNALEAYWGRFLDG